MKILKIIAKMLVVAISSLKNRDKFFLFNLDCEDGDKRIIVKTLYREVNKAKATKETLNDSYLTYLE